MKRMTNIRWRIITLLRLTGSRMAPVLAAPIGAGICTPMLSDEAMLVLPAEEMAG
jgi:hypothetical protein